MKRLLALVFAAVLVTTACGSNETASPPTPSSSSSTTTTTTTTAPSSSVPSPTSSPKPTTTQPPSASAQIAVFLTGARSMDRRLHAAATKINSGIGAETMTFSKDTIAAINAIAPHALVKTIPGGMSVKLRTQVLLLYSNLVARRGAFVPVLEMPIGQAVPRDGLEAKHLMNSLARGSTIAARFSADLAATHALASSEPPVRVAAPGSRATAEVLLIAQHIEGHNWGCGSSGGWLATTAVPVEWSSATTGRVGGVRFQVKYRANQGWHIETFAC